MYELRYREALNDILRNNVERDDRTGVGCFSKFNVSLSVDVSEHFPVLTGRRMFPKVFNTEFNWFILGETNIKRFQEANVKIWDAWADEDGELGPVYGHQLRNFNSDGIDQLKQVITSISGNPDSRRHVISLWNPVQLHEMALPPCYLYFQFFVEGGKLNMFVVQRSGDMFLGVPYDMALFTMILNYVASKTRLRPHMLDVNIIDAHIYKNQLDAVTAYLNEPVRNMGPRYSFKGDHVELRGYEYGPIITAPVAV